MCTKYESKNMLIAKHNYFLKGYSFILMSVKNQICILLVSWVVVATLADGGRLGVACWGIPGVLRLGTGGALGISHFLPEA